MTTVEHLISIGDAPFKVNGYQRSDGSVVNMRVRILPHGGYKQLIQQSIECIDSFAELLDETQYEAARDAVLKSLHNSLNPESIPKRVSYEVLDIKSDNVALLDHDPDKVIVFRVEVLDTETTVEPSKVVKSRDEISENKKKLMAALPVGRFCFRLNLYKGKYESIE